MEQPAEQTTFRDGALGEKRDYGEQQKARPLPRILVIDDEPLLGQAIRVGLRGVFDVDVELSGNAARGRLAAAAPYAAVFCDLRLSDSSGADVFASVVAERPELVDRFVIMTGGALSEDTRQFLESFRGLVLTKPFSIAKVEAVVASVIAQNPVTRESPA